MQLSNLHFANFLVHEPIYFSSFYVDMRISSSSYTKLVTDCSCNIYDVDIDQLISLSIAIVLITLQHQMFLALINMHLNKLKNDKAFTSIS